MENEDYLDKQQKLEQDNFLLKSKLIAKGGMVSDSPELHPEIENRFLQNVIDFDSAPTKPVHEILGINPAMFPHPDKLHSQELEAKFNELLDIMAEHDFYYELVEDLPIEIGYKYLVEEFLFEEEQVLPKGWRCHVNGCGGYCPGCFQLDYCKIWSETWTKEELEEEQKYIQNELL